MRLLFTLLAILLLVGCTITKRHFGPGYHVEWKKSVSKAEKEVENEKMVIDLREDYPSETESSVIHQMDSDSSNTQKEELYTEEMVLDKAHSPETVEFKVIETSSQRVAEKQLLEKDEPANDLKQRTEPLTWVSLILFVGIGVSAGLISMYSSFLYLGAGLFLSGLTVIFFVLALISFIRVRRHPERYKNKGLTTLMFLLAACSLIVSAVYLLFVSAMESMGQIM